MYGKLTNGILIRPPKFYNGMINYDLNEEKLKEDGWKEVLYTQPDLEPNEEQELFCTYEEVEGKIVQSWGVRDLPPSVLISRAKKQLDETDYQIIKCAEYQLAGLPCPYDIEVLHEKRQTLRDQINEWEELG